MARYCCPYSSRRNLTIGNLRATNPRTGKPPPRRREWAGHSAHTGETLELYHAIVIGDTISAKAMQDARFEDVEFLNSLEVGKIDPCQRREEK